MNFNLLKNNTNSFKLIELWCTIYNYHEKLHNYKVDHNPMMADGLNVLCSLWKV